MKFHPNEAYLATGGADRSVRLWSVCDARLVRVLLGHRAAVRALAFAPAGTHLASAGERLLIVNSVTNYEFEIIFIPIIG